jgi:alpha-tubulin suppressor-like RCC1 family protein
MSRLLLCGNVSSAWSPILSPQLVTTFPLSGFRATLHNSVLTSNEEGLWIDEKLSRSDLKNLRISEGGSRHFFVYDNKRCKGFGSNRHGQCSTPGRSVKEIACGWEISAAIADDNELVLWGRTSDVADQSDLNSRGEVKDLQGVALKKVVLGFGHVLVLALNGDAFVVGRFEKRSVAVFANNLYLFSILV